mmetsp:Transcript_2872/g.8119  ORF Transcript_2872/g.8119 Transcript_2872/m.8119 type:complete len:241 (+) Transcript_2872:709-1431(+)
MLAGLEHDAGDEREGHQPSVQDFLRAELAEDLRERGPHGALHRLQALRRGAVGRVPGAQGLELGEEPGRRRQRGASHGHEHPAEEALHCRRGARVGVGELLGPPLPVPAAHLLGEEHHHLGGELEGPLGEDAPGLGRSACLHGVPAHLDGGPRRRAGRPERAGGLHKGRRGRRRRRRARPGALRRARLRARRPQLPQAPPKLHAVARGHPEVLHVGVLHVQKRLHLIEAAANEPLGEAAQ